MSSDKPDPARAGALALLGAVREGATLDAAEGLLAGLPPEGRARARRLAATTLRMRGRADAALAPHLARKPRPEVVDLLRLGATELLATGAAPHGAISAAVTLARTGGGRLAAAAGMVNAVLRKVSDSGRPAWDAAPPTRLPDWLRGRLRGAWGEAATCAIEAAHEAAPPIDLTFAPGATPPEGVTLLPTGSVRMPAGTQVSALPLHAEGRAWVQDAAAALPALRLAARPGERVADLCAAPGGKTLQLAAAGARVTAVDLSEARLARVAENLARCGLAAELVAADVRAFRPDAPFDAVLLDAPCSATGTIRRHPELPLIRDGAGLREIVALQAELLDAAVAMLAPGGRLVFATCSLLPEEGEAQVAAALARHPHLTPDESPPPEGLLAGPHGVWRTRPGLWPALGGLDGFAIAALRSRRRLLTGGRRRCPQAPHPPHNPPCTG